MKTKFIELELGSHTIVHGFDNNNKEITETINVEEFSKKFVSLSRIKSISEKYILTDYTHGRWVYWEYEGDYNTLIERIK